MISLNPVQQIMIDLRAGRVSLDEARARLSGLLKPVRMRGPPANTDEMFQRTHDQDDPPYTTESWDDVYGAYVGDDSPTPNTRRCMTGWKRRRSTSTKPLSDRDPLVPAWADTSRQDWEALLRMATLSDQIALGLGEKPLWIAPPASGAHQQCPRLSLSASPRRSGWARLPAARGLRGARSRRAEVGCDPFVDTGLGRLTILRRLA